MLSAGILLSVLTFGAVRGLGAGRGAAGPGTLVGVSSVSELELTTTSWEKNRHHKDKDTVNPYIIDSLGLSCGRVKVRTGGNSVFFSQATIFELSGRQSGLGRLGRVREVCLGHARLLGSGSSIAASGKDEIHVYTSMRQ